MNSASPTIKDASIQDTYGSALLCGLTSSPILQRLTFKNNNINGLHVAGGTINDSRTWSNTDVVYYVDSPVTIAAGTGSLTLPAGLTVKFRYAPNSSVNTSLHVNGCLRILGTLSRPVILTSVRDDTAKVPDGTDGDTGNDGPSNGNRGDWYHIAFTDSSDDASCLIQHAEIRYSGGYWWKDGSSNWHCDPEETIAIVLASPTIEDSNFAGCWGYPVEMDLASFPRMGNLKAQGVDTKDISAVHIIGGTMAGSGTWSNPGIPYYLDSSVAVAAGQKLVIDPGTVIKFKLVDNIGLYFDNAKLDARQVSASPIVFTSIKDDVFGGDTNNDGTSSMGAAGDWGQVKLANTGGVDVGIRHAVFRYAGNGTGSAKIQALLLDFADAEILNCSFESCLDAAIRLVNSSIADIRDSVTKRNPIGIHLSGGSTSIIAGWTSFRDQTALVVDNAEVEICNSIISYYSPSGAGGYGVQVLNNGTLNIANCDVWSPWGTKYSTPPGDQTGQNGNISQNPKFMDIYTDNLRLQSDSPCRDTGDDACAVYYNCTTVAAGSINTIVVDLACAASSLVADWFQYGSDSTQRRITGVEFSLTNGTVSFAPHLLLASQAGEDIANYGSGDMDLHPRICGDHVDMGAYEFCPIFNGSECFAKDHSLYPDWLAIGKPNCWCGIYGTGPYPYQCDGDADNAVQGIPKYRVYTDDFNILVANWKKIVTDPNLNPCADFDHKPQGLPKYRVYTNDFNILVGNWKKTDAQLPGNCPRPD
jgi:hypothetical protein